MQNGGNRSLGNAWVFLCLALGLHVLDEALTGFLSVYNPTVLELKLRYPWWPMPVFSFGVWLWGLTAVVAILLGLSVFAYRGAAWIRRASIIFAVIMLLNGIGHTLGTMFARTVAEVHFRRPMPGFYSSPLLPLAAIYMILEATRAAREQKSVRAAGR